MRVSLSNPSEAPLDDMQAHLEKVLASASFRSSKRCQDFLRFVAERSWRNAAEPLKERTIGVEVFGRRPDYDTHDDSIVRVRANEVRKRLAQYYAEEGLAESLRIELPAGSYLVQVRNADPVPAPPVPSLAPVEVPLLSPPAAAEPPATPPAGAAAPPSPSRRPAFRSWWLAASLLAASAAALLLFWLPRPTDIRRDYWQPALQARQPVILCSGHPVVYTFSRDFRGRASGAPIDHYSAQTDPLRLKPDQNLSGRDIVPIRDQYIGIGSAKSVARIHAYLAAAGKDSEIRFGNDLTFTDLRKAPAVIIGAFQNRWAVEWTRDLRFAFETINGVAGIRDRKTGRSWTLPQLADDGRTALDYVLVSRILRSPSGEFTILGGGITQYGSQTAGEVLTNPAILSDILSRARPDWQSRSHQLLFRVRIIEGAPGPPELLEIHEW